MLLSWLSVFEKVALSNFLAVPETSFLRCRCFLLMLGRGREDLTKEINFVQNGRDQKACMKPRGGGGTSPGSCTYPVPM